jgi:hypothetical protein
MSATTAKYLGQGRRLRLALYALGILLAITVVGVIRTSPTTTTPARARSQATASLTDVNTLVIAPIADRTSNVGVPVVAVSPTATLTRPVQGSEVAWAAGGLPPGISISGGSGQLGGTPTTTGTYSVTVSATDDTDPPVLASQSFHWLVDDTAPKVTRVTPDAGMGGTLTVLRGKNLHGATSVQFGSTPVAFTVNRHGTAIVTYAPAEPPGVVDVTVSFAGGTRSPSAADRFAYEGPAITEVSRDSGPVSGGTRVRITGTDLAGATSVRFGDVPSQNFVVHRGGTVVTAIAPAGPVGTVPIVIVTPSAVVSTSGGSGFTYQAPAGTPAGTPARAAGPSRPST